MLRPELQFGVAARLTISAGEPFDPLQERRGHTGKFPSKIFAGTGPVTLSVRPLCFSAATLKEPFEEPICAQFLL